MQHSGAVPPFLEESIRSCHFVSLSPVIFFYLSSVNHLSEMHKIHTKDNSPYKVKLSTQRDKEAIYYKTEVSK